MGNKFNRRRLISLGMFAWLCLAVSPLSGPIGSAAAAEPVTLAVAGLAKLIYVPAILAAHLGYFREQGLDVELRETQAGIDSENSLLSGAVQGVIGFYDHTVTLQARGEFAESIVQLARAPGEVELAATNVDPEIASVADLRGKSVGVVGLGSSTEYLIRHVHLLYGLKSGQYALVPVGAGESFIAAMKSRHIVGGMTTEPTASRLLASGDARVLVDLRTYATTRTVLGGVYPGASLYVTSQWRRTHPKEAMKLARALVKALDFIAMHSPEEILAVLPADMYRDDKSAWLAALALQTGLFTADGRMPEKGPETVLAVLKDSNRNVQNRSIDLSKTFTNAFVDKIAAETGTQR